MKKLYYIIGLLTALFVVSCSESLEETYDEFAGDGMHPLLGQMCGCGGKSGVGNGYKWCGNTILMPG